MNTVGRSDTAGPLGTIPGCWLVLCAPAVYSCCEFSILEIGNVIKMSDTNITSTDPNRMDQEDQMVEEETRRTVKLSVKAQANKIEKDQKDRHSYVKQMKDKN